MRLALALLLAPLSAARAEPPRLALTLADAERQALAHSPVLKAAASSLEAAQAQADVQLSQLAPRVTADGGLQYQTEVPKVSLSPNAPALQFGDHRGWSVGPTLTYTLWDDGSLRAAWRSQKALAGSAAAQRDLLRRQVRLMTRLGYFQVQLSLEQARSLTDSLKLAEAQYQDISKRFHAGASSRIDWLSAHQQVLDRRRELRSAQGELAGALRALFSLTGQGQGTDVSAALDARTEAPLPPGVSTPTVVISLEPLESVEAQLGAAVGVSADPEHPQLLAYARQEEAARLAADALRSSRWPRLALSFKSDYQYPDLPLLSPVWQNTAGVTASVPLFELGRTRRQADAQRALADASARQREEASDELQRDWARARDQLAALRDTEVLDRDSVAETAEIAKLRYVSYRDGGSTILDVETANISAVQARVAAARTLTQVLIQLATLDSLAAPKVNP